MNRWILLALLAVLATDQGSGYQPPWGLDYAAAQDQDAYSRAKRSLPDRETIIEEMNEGEFERDDGTGEDNDQTVEFMIENTDTSSSAEVVLTNGIPGNAILSHFYIDNEGESYNVVEQQHRGKNQTPPENGDTIPAGRSSVRLGGETCLNCRENEGSGSDDPMPPQGAIASINVAPGDILSVSLGFVRPLALPRTLVEDLKAPYQTNTTVEVAYPARNIRGVIMSPNYPNSYPNNADLSWLIKLESQDLVINATLLSFESESCCDHLFVYDGASTSSPLISIVSGNTDDSNPSFISSGPNMLVVFQTDCAVNDGGFALEFLSQDLTSSSGGYKEPTNENFVVIGGSGFVSSPGYPLGYPPSSTLVWMLQSAPETYLSLSLVDFDFAPGDTLTVYDPIASETLVTLTGYDVSIGAPASGNEVVITAQTNAKAKGIVKRGFYITYVAQPFFCGGDVTLAEDDDSWHQILSPNYPSDYDNNLDCKWQITVPSTDFVYLEIASMDLETNYDFLRIYNIDETYGSTEIRALSGTGGDGLTYITTGNSASLRFHSDGSVTRSGFEINYRSYKGNRNCSNVTQTLNWHEGYIANYDYPSDTYIYSQCEWLIEVGSDKAVQIHIDQFDTWGYRNITIYDGANTSDDVLLSADDVNMYGSLSAISSSNKVLILVSNSQYTEYARYFLTYSSTDVTETNNTVLSKSPGQIKSPWYPSYYPPDTRYQWFIQATSDGKIAILFEEFELDSGDNVTISNGGSSSGDILKKCNYENYCRKGDNVLSNTSSVLVQFESDSAYSDGFFKFKYWFEDSSCSVLVCETSPDSGIALSPNYPSDYPNSYQGNYYISVSTGESISFHFDVFETESCCDYLRIYDGNSTSARQIADLSGRYTGYSGTTSGSDMMMVFTTDGSGTERGFRMSYSTNPIAAITPSAENAYTYSVMTDRYYYYYQNYIISPDTPDFYPNDQDYLWYFDSIYRAYRYSFEVFRVDIDSSDFLNFYEGIGTDSGFRGTLTGNYYNYDYSYFSITAPQATVWFHTDSEFSGMGFEMRYYSYY